MPVEGERSLRGAGLWVATKRSVDHVALALVLLLVCWWWFVLAIGGSPSDWAFDFRQFWQGGKDVVEGHSPYPDTALLASAGDHLYPEGIREVFRFPYPAGAAVALAPLGALEFATAAAVWSALLISALPVSLWILDVRDWRVLAIVVGSATVISAVRLGTLTPLLVLLLAVTWRWRDRAWVAGGALAVAIALKLFLWPVLVWLAATRRYSAAGVALGTAAAATVAAWAVIGFEGFADYPDLLRRLTEVVAGRGYSLVALGLELGVPRGLSDLLPYAAGIAVLVVVVAVALSRRGRATDVLAGSPRRDRRHAHRLAALVRPPGRAARAGAPTARVALGALAALQAHARPGEPGRPLARPARDRVHHSCRRVGVAHPQRVESVFEC